jgi:hypothetical protein
MRIFCASVELRRVLAGPKNNSGIRRARCSWTNLPKRALSGGAGIPGPLRHETIGEGESLPGSGLGEQRTKTPIA